MKTELDINKRWEKGTPHHPKSEALYERLETADLVLQDDSFGFKSGGDGDNGENLMYLLDIIFEAEDNRELEELDKFLKKSKRKALGLR